MLISQFGCKATKKGEEGSWALIILGRGRGRERRCWGRLQMRTYDTSLVAVAMGQSRWGGRGGGSFLTPLPCVDMGLKKLFGEAISREI